MGGRRGRGRGRMSCRDFCCDACWAFAVVEK